MEIKISRVLKRLRSLEKITQKDLAQELNLERGNIAKYENAITIPPLDVLVAIVEHFDVSLDYLVFGESSSTSSDSLREKELMADTLVYMSKMLDLERELKEARKEVEMLKEMNNSSQKYIQHLENKIKY